jgi:N-acetylglucosamine repressor
MTVIPQKATREQTKEHNKRLILRVIYDRQQTSRVAISHVTHLTRPTVSSIVAELIEEGLVKEIGQRVSSGGKPATLLSVQEDARHLIGADLANSEFRGSVINLRGKVRHYYGLPINDRDGEVALALVYELIDELVAAASSPLLGIGIGTPGLMDFQQGVVRNAVNLDWQDLPLGDLLRKRYHLPIYIANDSQVAALAEYTFGDSKGIQNLVVIKVGRGVGAGIVLNGQLYFGDRFGAGEIGHVVLVEDGERCRCGHCGCLETVSSSRAVVKRACAIAEQNPGSLLCQFASTPEEINTNVVLQAFEAGEEALRPVIAEAGRYLGIAVANLVSTLNVQRIVVAGSLSRFGQPLLEPVIREMNRRALPALVGETQVEISGLGRDIVILGAAALLLAEELGLI